MLYDLNIPWSSTTSPTSLQRTISFLSSLGYDTLALNHEITSDIPSQIVNPIPVTPSFPMPEKTTLLRRCTLSIADPSLNHRLPAIAAVFDILAVRPTTEKAFLAACSTLTEHSLISLDLTQRFPFHFRPKPFMTAVNRGVRFEICYGQATMEDAAARRNFIGNCMGIIRATKGRGLVISSEARGVLGVRAPADVVNLLGVWGLARERGLEGMGVNPRGVVVNEGLKRSAFRGVIDVIDGGEKVVVVVPEKEKSSDAPGVMKKGMGKRKPEDGVEEAAPQLSKRQVKRLRKEAQKSETGGLSAVPTPSKPTPNQGADATRSIKPKANT